MHLPPPRRPCPPGRALTALAGGLRSDGVIDDRRRFLVPSGKKPSRRPPLDVKGRLAVMHVWDPHRTRPRLPGFLGRRQPRSDRHRTVQRRPIDVPQRHGRRAGPGQRPDHRRPRPGWRRFSGYHLQPAGLDPGLVRYGDRFAALADPGCSDRPCLWHRQWDRPLPDVRRCPRLAVLHHLGTESGSVRRRPRAVRSFAGNPADVLRLRRCPDPHDDRRRRSGHAGDQPSGALRGPSRRHAGDQLDLVPTPTSTGSNLPHPATPPS